LQAIQRWQDLSRQIKPDDPEDRGWYLLALQRASQLEDAVHDRRQYVLNQLREADEASRTGRPNRAIEIRSNLVEQYQGYTDLSDLFLAPSPPVSPTPEAATPGPETPSSSPPVETAPADSSKTSSPSQTASPRSAPAEPEAQPPPPSSPDSQKEKRSPPRPDES
jgi:hypothetical protein